MGGRGRLEVADLPGGWNALAAHVYYTRVDHWMTDQFRTSALGKGREYSMGTRGKTAIAGGGAFKANLLSGAAFNQGFVLAHLPVRGARR